MRAKLLIVMTIILASQLLGEIKADGKLLIPTATGEKPYKCVMVITQVEIRLECDKKIFKLFNHFDAPKQARLKVSKADLTNIVIQGNNIYVETKDAFTILYRNVFNQSNKFLGYNLIFPKWKEVWVLIFNLDNPIPADIVTAVNDLKKSLANDAR